MTDAGKPLHIDDLLKRIEDRFRQRVKKATLVGGLARKVKQHDTFTRPARSTYGLISFGKGRGKNETASV